jgi:phosphoribosyl-AMP cyclohydrolase / phosphoribosyl-ATP pyrophosphohydrolase
MLGYMNQAALRLTRETGLVHFWSRSRQTLWKKGETSGNTLSLVEVSEDCDGDALLVRAIPAGPTCHTGQISCFDQQPADQGFASLEKLWDTVRQRAATRPAGSYTSSLLEGGADATARKLIEEATEVLIAAKDHASGTADDRRLSEEAADLVYHLLVLLAERNTTPSGFIEVLIERSR